MDHDIDFRDVMSELLKKRRKLAAVRLQFWPSAPQEIVKFLRDKLVVPADRCYTQTSPLDPGLLFRLASRVSADSNHTLCSYPPATPDSGPRRIMICMPKPTNMTFCSLTRTRASARSSAC